MGAPTDSARSMTLWIFSAKTSPSAPPNTVKSCANTNTLRPSMVPQPVTTPSVSGRVFSMPNPCARWRASMSSSTNEPGSSSFSSRSRAVSLPAVVLTGDRRLAPRVERLLAQDGELLEAFLDRVRHGCDRRSRAVVAVQRLGLGLRLDLGLVEGHGSRGYRWRLPTHSWTSSIRVPNASLGCTKATVVPRLPGRGASSMTRWPAAFTGRAPRRSRRPGSRRGGALRPLLEVLGDRRVVTDRA